MAGFVIDIWIAFLFRTAMNAWKRLVSVSWIESNGEITGFNYVQPLIGCDYGEYHYTYFVSDVVFEGAYIDPYFVSRSKEAQSSDSVGTTVRLLVNPRNPARSVLKSF